MTRFKPTVVQQLHDYDLSEHDVTNVGQLFALLFPHAGLEQMQVASDLYTMPLPSECGCQCAQLIFAARRFAELCDGGDADGSIARITFENCLVFING